MELIDLIRARLELGFRGPAWHGPSLLEALEGLDAVAAGARPLSGAHSIAEVAAHAAAWKRIAADRARGEDWRDVPSAEDWPRPASWEAVRSGLERAHADLLEAVGSLGERELSRSLGDTSLAETLLGVAQHDVYHAGQVALLRRGLSGRATA